MCIVSKWTNVTCSLYRSMYAAEAPVMYRLHDVEHHPIRWEVHQVGPKRNEMKYITNMVWTFDLIRCAKDTKSRKRQVKIVLRHALCELLGQDALAGLGLGLGLDPHDTTAPLPPELVVPVIEVGLHRNVKARHVAVFWCTTCVVTSSVHTPHSEARGQRYKGGRGAQAATHRAEAGLALGNAIRDAHLAAQRRQPHHELDGVHVVRNHNQLRLTLRRQPARMDT
eukprot:SM000328S12463  [mRNA]  locus=s328:83578:85857:+ [translate_table: standard]